MIPRLAAVALALAVLPSALQAQRASLTFDQAAYVTCREAQAMAPEAPTQRRIERDLAREAIAARAQADLEKRFEVGGLAEAVIRAIMHVRLPERTVDERGFAVLQAIRRLQPANRRRSLGEIKTMFREQYMLLRLDEERAVRAIPRLLPDDEERRVAGWKAVTDVLAASGALPGEGRRRLERLRELFAAPGRPSTKETDLG